MKVIDWCLSSRQEAADSGRQVGELTSNEIDISRSTDSKASSTPADSRSPNAHALELMESVFKGPLNPAQQQQVIGALQSDPDFVNACNITPQKVEELMFLCRCSF